MKIYFFNRNNYGILSGGKQLQEYVAIRLIASHLPQLASLCTINNRKTNFFSKNRIKKKHFGMCIAFESKILSIFV